MRRATTLLLLAAVATSTLCAGVSATVHAAANTNTDRNREPRRRHVTSASQLPAKHRRGAKKTSGGLSPAAIPLGAMPMKYGIPNANASFQYIQSCDLASGNKLLVQAYEPMSAPTVFLASVVDPATGIVTQLAEVSMMANFITAAACTSTGGAVLYTDYGIALLGGTGTVTRFAGIPTVSAVGVEGGAAYAVTADNLMVSIDLATAAIKFTVNVSCVKMTTLVLPQPAANASDIPAAVYVGCNWGNGTIYDGSTGAVAATTPINIDVVTATIATPSAVVAVTATGGYGISWTTGATSWTNAAFTTAGGNLAALPNDLIAVTAMTNPATGPCSFIVASARTGVAQSTVVFGCSMDEGVTMAAVPGAPSLVSTGYYQNDEMLFVASVFDAASTTGKLVLNTTFEVPDCTNTIGQCPNMNNWITACGSERFVVARPYVTDDGLYQPIRAAVFNRSTGQPIVASKHVVSNMPDFLTCAPLSTQVTFVSPLSVVSMDVAAVTSIEPADVAERPRKVAAAGSSTSTPTIAPLWSYIPVNANNTVAFGVFVSEAIGALVLIRDENIVLHMAAATGQNTTRWSVPTCKGYGGTISVDKINGIAWAMCGNGNATGVNMTNGAIVFVVPASEPNPAGFVFLPGRVLYTAAPYEMSNTTFISRTIATDGTFSAPTSVTLPGQNLWSIRVLQSAGAGDVAALMFTVSNGFASSQLFGVDLATMTVKWSHTALDVAAMPCSGTVTQRVGDAVVIVGLLPNLGVPAIMGLSPLTGAPVWNISLAATMDNTQGQALFTTTCAALGDGFVTLATPSSVTKFSTSTGGIAWTRVDERYYVPTSALTFSAGYQGPLLAGITDVIMTTAPQGAYMLDASTGANRGAFIPSTITGWTFGYQAFTGVAGFPSLVLAAGPTALNLLDATGALVSSTSGLLGYNEGYSWGGSAFDDSTGVATVALVSQNSQWFGLYSVSK
jgi:hypothetical protein